jgi:hypothetical protein
VNRSGAAGAALFDYILCRGSGGAPLAIGLNLEKAVEPQISQINTDYQGIAKFKALTQRVSFN